MMIVVILLWVSLLLGQLGAIPLGGGVILYVQDIILCLMILTAFARYGLLTKLLRFPLMRPIALFAGLGVVSLIANVSRYPVWVVGYGSLYLVRWVAYSMFYGVILLSPYSATFWLWWLTSFGVVLSVIGLVQFVWYPDLRNLWYLGWDPHYYRVFATLLDPNYVGILLVLTIFTLVYVFNRFRRLRAWVIMLMGLAGIALLLTYSRSSYLGLLAGVGVGIVMLKRWKEGVFLVLIILLAIVYVPKPGGDTLTLDRFDSTTARIQNWQETIKRISERPVFGYGFNVVPFLGNKEATALPGRRGAGIDSSLLFVGVTTGLVGLVSYLWLLVAEVRLALKIKNVNVAILMFSSLGAVFVHSLFVNSLFYPWVMIWLWTLIGVAQRERKTIVGR